jgi:hypothetical protein
MGWLQRASEDECRASIRDGFEGTTLSSTLKSLVLASTFNHCVMNNINLGQSKTGNDNRY